MSARELISMAGGRHRARGFTLVEMIITLTVFVLLSAMVFGIITGVLESAGSLEQNQDHGDQTMALHAFLRKQLGSLPGQSTLISYRRGDGEGLDQNGIIFGTTTFLTAIDAKVQPNGLYRLRLATFSSNLGSFNNTLFKQNIISNENSIAWTNLMQDVKSIRWRFQDLNGGQWVNEWNNTSNKPNLTEISIQQGGEVRPYLMDFWIPPIYTEPSNVSAVNHP